MTEKSLTPKQQRFVGEYLVDLNAKQAAIRAGYSAKTAEWIGPQLLGKTHVSAEIQRAIADRSKRTEITQDYVLKTIYETVERCRQAEPVTDKNGEQIVAESQTGDMLPAFVFDAKNVLKGCELLGKHLGVFEKDNEQKGNINVIASITRKIIKDGRSD